MGFGSPKKLWTPTGSKTMPMHPHAVFPFHVTCKIEDMVVFFQTRYAAEISNESFHDLSKFRPCL
jgi:hypothetical protein